MNWRISFLRRLKGGAMQWQNHEEFFTQNRRTYTTDVVLRGGRSINTDNGQINLAQTTDILLTDLPGEQQYTVYAGVEDGQLKEYGELLNNQKLKKLMVSVADDVIEKVFGDAGKKIYSVSYKTVLDNSTEQQITILDLLKDEDPLIKSRSDVVNQLVIDWKNKNYAKRKLGVKTVEIKLPNGKQLYDWIMQTESTYIILKLPLNCSISPFSDETQIITFPLHIQLLWDQNNIATGVILIINKQKCIITDEDLKRMPKVNIYQNQFNVLAKLPEYVDKMRVHIKKLILKTATEPVTVELDKIPMKELMEKPEEEIYDYLRNIIKPIKSITRIRENMMLQYQVAQNYLLYFKLLISNLPTAKDLSRDPVSAMVTSHDGINGTIILQGLGSKQIDLYGFQQSTVLGEFIQKDTNIWTTQNSILQYDKMYDIILIKYLSREKNISQLVKQLKQKLKKNGIFLLWAKLIENDADKMYLDCNMKLRFFATNQWKPYDQKKMKESEKQMKQGVCDTLYIQPQVHISLEEIEQLFGKKPSIQNGVLDDDSVFLLFQF